MLDLKSATEHLLADYSLINSAEFAEYPAKFIAALNAGEIRSAEKASDGNWKVNTWVKQGILLLFKIGKMSDMSSGGFSFFDKDTIPMRIFDQDAQVRIVPGGSSVRTGAYLAKGVICMPPMYVNIGAYVDEGTMIDSHALVGTCAQVGRNVHLSAASQIGGVLEPAGASPVIIEDNVMIGGNCGVYEGVIVREKAILGTGVILNASTRVYDIVNGRVLSATATAPLEIPSGAVVVPGARKVSGSFAEANGLSIATPLIVKYRDDKTDARTALEEALR